MISSYSHQQTLEFYRRARSAGLVGEDGTEFAKPGYSRAPILFSAADNELANAAPVYFPIAPQRWGDVVALALFDESGNFLISDPLPRRVTIRAQDQLFLPIGALTCALETEAVI